MTLKTCTGWHTVGRREDGSAIVEWRQWYSYDGTPCPEHGYEMMKPGPPPKGGT